MNVYLFNGDPLTGGFSGNWSIARDELAHGTRLELYALSLPGRDEADIIRLIKTNSTSVQPRIR